MRRDSFIDRQNLVLDLAEVPSSVGRAMHLWVQWMRSDEVGEGWPKRCPIFGGGSAIHGFDDMCDQADGYAGAAVDAAVESLKPELREMVKVVWLGHKPPKRVNPGTVSWEVIENRLAAIGIRCIHASISLKGVC